VQASVVCEPGDILVVFSDGIQEAVNGDDQEFGYEGIAASLKLHFGLAPGEMCSAILDDVRKFTGGRTPDDDQTLLVIKLEGVAHSTQAELTTAMQR